MTAAAGFAWLAAVVAPGSTSGFDFAVRDGIHRWASEPLTAAMRAATQFGDGWVLWPLGMLIVVWLEREGRRMEAVLFAIAVIGANLVDEGMKLVFHRPRPEPFFGYPSPVTYSFPSGHSFVSCCFYLALAEVLVDPDWGAGRKVGVWMGAAAVTLLVGLSRVYLGVHYPTDVMGGYAGAVAWAALVRVAHHRWWSRTTA